ncbi:MAG: hypothetical protein NT138_25470 [Planctomycetales bacterium]|nr:hypothetical protein [Planctomycetales bacterium]
MANSSIDAIAGGRITLGAFHHMTLGDVIAGKEVSIRVWGDVNTGEVSSDSAGIYVEGHSVSGQFTTSKKRLPHVVETLGIPSIGGIQIRAWGSFSGSVSAGNNNQGQGHGSANIVALNDANIHESSAEIQLSVVSGGKTSGTVARGNSGVSLYAGKSLKVDSVSSRGSVGLSALEEIVAGVDATGDSVNKTHQNVTVATGGKVTADIKAGCHTIIIAGDGFEGSIRSGGQVRITSGSDVTATVKSDDDLIQQDWLRELNDTHGIKIHAFGKLKGRNSGGPSSASNVPDFESKGVIQVCTFGDISGSFKAGKSASIVAHVSGGVESAPLASNFVGSIWVGVQAKVKIAGDIQASVEAAQSVSLEAHGSVKDTTITMSQQTGTVLVGADNAIEGLTISNSSSSEIASINGIDRLVLDRGGKATVDSHAEMKIKVEGVDEAVLKSRDDLTLDGKFIGQLLRAVSFDGSVTLNMEQSRADVSVQSYGQFNGTVTTTGDIGIEAKGTITGTIKGGSIDAISLTSIDATVIGTGAVFAYGVNSVAGQIESTRAMAEAGAMGSSGGVNGTGISATVSACGPASVWALSGSVTGPVNSKFGDASILALLNVTGTVNAGGEVSIEAGGNVTGKITGKGLVEVTAFGTMTGEIKSEDGRVEALAGDLLSSKIDAEKGIEARTFLGDITGAIESTFGLILVESGGAVSGEIKALSGSIDIYAVSNISGSLTATNGFIDAYALLEGITGGAKASDYVNLSARDSISGNVESGRDVRINTWLNSTGNVVAGRDIRITAGGNIEGSLTAERDATLWAARNVHTTLIKATTGDVDIEAWGGFKEQAQAPAGMVSIWTSGEVAEAVITANETVSIYSYGQVGVNITTSADVYVFGHNNVNGIINAVELVDVAALRAMDVQITTAGKAEVYSLENAKVVGDADSGFSIVSDGALEVDANSLDGDVITWSLEQTTGTIDAGGYADSVSWGLTDLESEGDEGAYAWSYGNLSGKFTSSLGYAIGVSLWNNDADYSSETVSAALAGGNVSGMVFSWGDADVFAGGNVSSLAITAVDGTAIVMSFGNVNSHVSTGDLAIVFAALDISGVVDGEYAALAFAGQNLEATVKSDGSVWLALAGGNISGAITGDVSVNDVFAYGNISSTIKAGSESSSNGIVESVEAIGTISGQIIATSSIGSVRSGSTVTATLTAPSKPTPIENDAGVAAENPPLDPWDSGMTEIRADLATRRAEWVSKRDDARISRDQDVSKNNDSRQAELNRISDGRIERFREGTSIIGKNVAALREAKQSFVAFVKQHRDEQTKSDHALEERFEKDRRDETEARNVAIQNAAEAFHTSFVEWTQEKDRIAELKSQFADRAQKQQQDLEADQQAFEAAAPTMMSKITSWLEWANSRMNILTLALNAPGEINSILESQAQIGTQLGEVLGADGVVDSADYATIIGYGIGDMLVAVKAYKAWEGVDPLTGIELSDNDRMEMAAFAVVEFAGAVASGLSIAGGFRTKCPGPNCFIGDTQIIIGQHDSGPVLAQCLPIETGNNSAFAVLCLIVGAMSGIAVLRDEKRSKRLTAARPPGLETMPDHANAGTDLAFSDPVDLLQGVPETTTGPVDRNSKDGLVPGNRVIADNTCEVTSESDVSSVLTASGTNSVGKSVRTTTLKAIAVVSLMLSAWFGLNRPAIDSAAMSPAVAEMTANLADQSPRWDSVAIQDVVTGQFVTVGLPDGESQPLPEDTLTEKAPKQDATGVTEWLEYPADEFVSFPIRIAVRDGVIVDVDGKDSNASLKNLISTKYVVGDADGTDVTRLLCRTIDLEMPKPDGSIAELSVIRPLWWLQGTGAAVGGSIDIGLHEIGLSGEATVLAIGPCDVDSRETRPGMSIVTGTIRHRNATVWDLTFDDCTEETLGVTANHPLYSESRHAWIPAGDLQLDEVVRTLNGHSTLTARTQRPTRETVFNLEVHRSHAYHVSTIGVLAHNTGLPCPPGLRTWQEAKMNPDAARRIQNAANKTNQRITVVGSRAKGKTDPASDWDYIASGRSRQRGKAKNSLPRGAFGGEDNTGIDWWQDYNPRAPNFNPVDPNLPHVIFDPQ